MKKLILKRRTFEIVPYNHEVVVVFTNDIRRAAAKLKDEIGEDITDRIRDNMHALTMFVDGRSTLHILFEMRPDVGTLAHEIFHAVDFVLRYSRVKCEFNVSNETWAYHLGDLTRKVVKFYHQVNSNKKFNTSNRAE